ACQYSRRLLGQMYDVGFCVLGPRFRKGPNSLCEIQLFPLQPGDLFAALSGERQKLKDTTVRPTDFSSGKDNVCELVVVQHSVASDLLRRQWHAFGWGSIEDGSTHAPAQERLGHLQSFIGGNRRPPLLDGGDDLDDITLANLVNAPARPGLPNLPAKKPSDLAAGAILRQALRYEGLQ